MKRRISALCLAVAVATSVHPSAPHNNRTTTRITNLNSSRLTPRTPPPSFASLRAVLRNHGLREQRPGNDRW
jgi:hypothetical protein